MKNYTDKNIKVLSDVEHIRMRPEMVAGYMNNPHHLFTEAFDNAKDELQSGNGDLITVEVNTKLNQYIIKDNGRGIPIGTKELNGKQVEIVKVLCVKSNSGAKFDTDENRAYQFSGGLHGIGLVLINALSKSMSLQTIQNGKVVSYVSDPDSISYGKCKKSMHGTTVTFIPDGQYFEDSDVIPLSFIKNTLKFANALGITSELYVDNEKIDISCSLEDLISNEKDTVTYWQLPLMESSKNKDEERLNMCIRYTSDTKDKYVGYANLIKSSGSHVDATIKTICDAWEEYIRKSKIELSTELYRSDYLLGIRGISICFIKNPKFIGQTKDSLSMPKTYFDEMSSILRKQLVNVLKENDKQSKALIKRFEEYRISQNKLLSKKSIEKLITINDDKPDNIRRRSNVPGLIECTQTKRDGTELCIVEGLSAAGPVIRTRNKNTQACLPLRGKILNVAGMSATQALKSDVIRNIANSIGGGIGTQFNVDKRRYDKIMIMSDSDPDGYHIQNLILCVLVNLFADMIKEGNVYIVEAPLYAWIDKKGEHYTNNLLDIPKNIRYKRFKGLGEMSDEEYKYCLMNASTRHLYKVDYPTDIDEFNVIMQTSQGKRNILEEMGLIKYE